MSTPGPDPLSLTTLIAAAGRGDGDAAAKLLPLIYQELHAQARERMARESPGHTLQPTALVHEAYLRLVGNGDQSWQNRAHFFGAAAEAMRRILIEHARSKGRLKRGGKRGRIDLDHVELAAADPEPVLCLDAALSKLETFDPRLAEIVKMRCFVGMSIAETAEALGVSTRTVDRQWILAKAWLKGELERETDGEASA